MDGPELGPPVAALGPVAGTPCSAAQRRAALLAPALRILSSSLKSSVKHLHWAEFAAGMARCGRRLQPSDFFDLLHDYLSFTPSAPGALPAAAGAGAPLPPADRALPHTTYVHYWRLLEDLLPGVAAAKRPHRASTGASGVPPSAFRQHSPLPSPPPPLEFDGAPLLGGRPASARALRPTPLANTRYPPLPTAPAGPTAMEAVGVSMAAASLAEFFDDRSSAPSPRPRPRGPGGSEGAELRPASAPSSRQFEIALSRLNRSVEMEFRSHRRAIAEARRSAAAQQHSAGVLLRERGEGRGVEEDEEGERYDDGGMSPTSPLGGAPSVPFSSGPGSPLAASGALAPRVSQGGSLVSSYHTGTHVAVHSIKPSSPLSASRVLPLDAARAAHAPSPLPKGDGDAELSGDEEESESAAEGSNSRLRLRATSPSSARRVGGALVPSSSKRAATATMSRRHHSTSGAPSKRPQPPAAPFVYRRTFGETKEQARHLLEDFKHAFRQASTPVRFLTPAEAAAVRATTPAPLTATPLSVPAGLRLMTTPLDSPRFRVNTTAWE